MTYDTPVPEYADVMTVEDFRQSVRSGAFIDYDGFGHPVRDGLEARISVRPSTVASIPKDATHIAWYNR
jgi:hypothetical protein